MGAFGGLFITNKGKALQAKAQAGTALNFTKIAMGDGTMSGQQIAEMTALISLKKSLSITKLKTLPGGKAVVGAKFDNTSLVTGFYFRELGVFAQDPDEGEILYCYGNAGTNAEYIPAGGGPDIVEKYIDAVTIVGNAANVSATIEQSLVYVSQQTFDAHLSAANPHNQYLLKTGGDITGLFSFPSNSRIKGDGTGNGAYSFLYFGDSTGGNFGYVGKANNTSQDILLGSYNGAVQLIGSSVKTNNNTIDDGSAGTATFKGNVISTASGGGFKIQASGQINSGVFQGSGNIMNFGTWDNATARFTLNVSTGEFKTKNNTLDDGTGKSYFKAIDMSATSTDTMVPTNATWAVHVGAVSSPFAGRTVFGDGSGWRYGFSRKTTANTYHDMFVIYDNGLVGTKNNTLDNGSGAATFAGSLTINRPTGGGFNASLIVQDNGVNKGVQVYDYNAGLWKLSNNGGTNYFDILHSGGGQTIVGTLNFNTSVPLSFRRGASPANLFMSWKSNADAEIAWMGYGTNSDVFGINNTLGALQLNLSGQPVTTKNNILDNGTGQAFFRSTTYIQGNVAAGSFSPSLTFANAGFETYLQQDSSGRLTIWQNASGSNKNTMLMDANGNVVYTGGGTFAGTVDTNNGTSAPGQGHFRMRTGNQLRFAFGLIGAESTGNAGSNFRLWGYDDTGTSLGEYLKITRGSGALYSKNNTIDDGSGAAVFSGRVQLDFGGAAMRIKPGSLDHAYVEFYADSQSPNTRSGYYGYASTGTNQFTIANEMTNGDMTFTVNGTGKFTFNKDIVVAGNTAWHSGNMGAGRSIEFINPDSYWIFNLSSSVSYTGSSNAAGAAIDLRNKFVYIDEALIRNREAYLEVVGRHTSGANAFIQIEADGVSIGSLIVGVGVNRFRSGNIAGSISGKLLRLGIFSGSGGTAEIHAARLVIL